MPARARACGGSARDVLPSRRMRAGIGRSAPAIRLKSDDLPAPFGPMMPSAAPASTPRSILSATTTEPKAFDSFSSSQDHASAAPVGVPGRGRRRSHASRGRSRSGDRLHLAAHRNLRRRLVVDDDEIVLAVVLQPPLAADERRLGDVLGGEGRQVGAVPLHRAGDRVEIGRDDRGDDRASASFGPRRA